MQEPSTSPKQSWKRLTILGGSLEVLGFGAAQVVRLGGNLLLTRLLAPEAFGLVALVSLVYSALQMFSDFGFFPAIIQHPRGGTPEFLNTAWTLQLVRGALLVVVMALIAWPMTRLYQEPLLTWLIMVGAISTLSVNATSTAFYSLRRKIRVAPIVTLEIFSQVATTAVIVGLAYWLRSVWALAIGSSIGAILRTSASYLLPDEHKHRISWDKEAVSHILHFGKWVFLSSAVYFLSRQGDRLLLGKLLGMSELGVYSIAVMLSEVVRDVTQRVVHGVVFPVLSRVREQGIPALGNAYYKVRAALDGAFLPALGLMAALSNLIIDVLYDDRYQAAGWMLQALTLRAAMTCILLPGDSCLTAIGKPRYTFLEGVARGLWIVICVPIGYHYFGLSGLVWAVALSEIPVAAVIWIPMHQAGLLRWWREGLTPFMFLAGFAIGNVLEPLLRRLL